MNIWDDEWGEQEEDWSGGAARPTLRTPDGERQLEEGEVVHFPAGSKGAHGLRNDAEETVRYIMAGTRVSPEVVEYPDLRKVTGQSDHGIFFIHDLEAD